MGSRGVVNSRRVQTRVKQGTAAYKAMLFLARTVVAKMTAAVATFAVPVPALADVTTAADTLQAKVAVMGHKRNRASKAQKLACQAATAELRDLLTSLEAYAKNTCLVAAAENSPEYNALLASSGFGLRGSRGIANRLSTVRRVSQTNNDAYGAKAPRLSWEKPKGLIHGLKPAGYNIIISGRIVATTVRTNIKLDAKNLSPAGKTDVEIVPFNSRGNGQSIFCTVQGPHI